MVDTIISKSAYLWDLMKLFYIEIYDLLCAKVELNNFKIIKSKNFHILSPLIYRFYKNEKVASKFSIFDSFLSYIPFFKNYSSNIILLCQKV